MRSAQQIYQLLTTSKQTHRLLRQVALHKQLGSLLQASLPSPLADYCQAGELNNHAFTIITASPVWAAKLRYLLPTLLKTLQQYQDFSQVTEIKLKISNSFQHQEYRPSHVPRPAMSPQSASVIEQTAQTIRDDSLRESLLRLSKHGKKS